MPTFVGEKTCFTDNETYFLKWFPEVELFFKHFHVKEVTFVVEKLDDPENTCEYLYRKGNNAEI